MTEKKVSIAFSQSIATAKKVTLFGYDMKFNPDGLIAFLC